MTEEEPKRTLVISTIENGTVIDHIKSGEALTVLRILGITGSTQECVSVATNVVSRAQEKKDVVKIENRELKAKEVDRIALVAPNATINIIRNYRVIDKKGVIIPSVLIGVLKCPNPCCITNTNEPVMSRFEMQGKKAVCTYCDAVISSDISSHII